MRPQKLVTLVMTMALAGLVLASCALPDGLKSYDQLLEDLDSEAIIDAGSPDIVGVEMSSFIDSDVLVTLTYTTASGTLRSDLLCASLAEWVSQVNFTIDRVHIGVGAQDDSDIPDFHETLRSIHLTDQISSKGDGYAWEDVVEGVADCPPGKGPR